MKWAQNNNKQSDKQVRVLYMYRTNSYNILKFNPHTLLSFAMVIIIWFAGYIDILIRMWMMF